MEWIDKGADEQIATIGRLRFVFRVGQAHAQPVQYRCSAWAKSVFKTSLTTLIQRLEQAVPNFAWQKIDCLSINLGDIQLDALESELEAKLWIKLEHCLKTYLYQRPQHSIEIDRNAISTPSVNAEPQVRWPQPQTPPRGEQNWAQACSAAPTGRYAPGLNLAKRPDHLADKRGQHTQSMGEQSAFDPMASLIFFLHTGFLRHPEQWHPPSSPALWLEQHLADSRQANWRVHIAQSCLRPDALRRLCETFTPSALQALSRWLLAPFADYPVPAKPNWGIYLPLSALIFLQRHPHYAQEIESVTHALTSRLDHLAEPVTTEFEAWLIELLTPSILPAVRIGLQAICAASQVRCMLISILSTKTFADLHQRIQPCDLPPPSIPAILPSASAHPADAKTLNLIDSGQLLQSPNQDAEPILKKTSATGCDSRSKRSQIQKTERRLPILDKPSNLADANALQANPREANLSSLDRHSASIKPRLLSPALAGPSRHKGENLAAEHGPQLRLKQPRQTKPSLAKSLAPVSTKSSQTPRDEHNPPMRETHSKVETHRLPPKPHESALTPLHGHPVSTHFTAPQSHHPIQLKSVWAGEILEPTEKEALAVSNAGIILLWPLLPRLFRTFELTQEQNFVDENARMQAICYLDWLAWGDEAVAEWRAPLNRLLCALPPTQELLWQSPALGVRTQLDAWLMHVLTQLPNLSRCGISDLRTLFLQRPGELRKVDNHKVLTLESNAVDVLLHDLPWSLTQVSLPWLVDPLPVTWL